MKKMSFFLLCLCLPLITRAYAPPNLFSVALGGFDFTRAKYRTWEFELEYKFLLSCFTSPWEFLEFRPLVGVMATATKSVYLYGGLNFDLLFWNHLLIAPGFAAGYYAQGHGKNLGYPLEFRSGVELAYQTCDGHRLGVHFYHLSNASLASRNPGEESIVFYFDIPIKKGFPFNN
ncbi:MAG: acyloxyacyl hydrolase [Chlamydiales bacterium]|nr:acyloxyacyl hydrolase [Chlamydiales bacterium]